MAKKLPWKVVEQDGQRGLILPDVDAEDFDMPTSAAYQAEVELADDDQILSVKVPTKRFVPFAKPGLRVEADRLYTVKAVTPSGMLVQIPLEDQINNQKAAPSMALGLAVYSIKGFLIYYDITSQVGAWCPTKNCWAEWNAKYAGFCVPAHRAITKPEAPVSGFSLNPTTSDT